MLSKDNFRTIEPYVPGDQPNFPDMVKLNTNENPYPPAPGVLRAAEQFRAENLKLYPPVDGGELRTAIAEYHGFERECVFVGVGSDDVLSVIFQTCFNSGRAVIFPEISYSFYEVWGEMYKVPYRKIPLMQDYTINAEDYIPTGNLDVNGGVIICNPNAPTAMTTPLDQIERIVKANSGSVVVVDEAYVDFGGESALPLLKDYDNLIVVRTFSKSRSMAGLRIGYAISSKTIISAMNDIKNSVNSYTMNRTAVEIGKASLAEEEYFRNGINKIVATRTRLVEELDKLGFKTLPSSANFVFTTHTSIKAADIYAALKEKHIYVRYFAKPLIDNFLRITVGTDEEIDILLRELKSITQKVM